MENNSTSKKFWWIAGAALLFVSVPAGLWMKHKTQQSPAASNPSETLSSTAPNLAPAANKAPAPVSPGSNQTALDSNKVVVAPALPGLPVQPAAKPAAPIAPVASAPKEPQGCLTLSFRHKKTPGHSSDDACGAHKNLVQLKHPVNPASVCVRVNKRPVAFQTVKGHPDQLLVGAVAGPSSEITVRYCLGKTKCSEDCTVAKDEFMAAIGGSDESAKGNGQQVAQWDPSDTEKDVNVNAQLDKDVRDELEKLDESRPDSHLASVFQDWLPGAEAPACGTRQAMN